MSEISRLWAGRVYGTNTGNAFVELESKDGDVAGTLRFADDQFGPVVYALKGKFDGATVELEGEATQSPEGVENGELSIKGTLTSEGQLRGQWSSSLGTGGTFNFFPHEFAEKASLKDVASPEQVHVAVRPLGALRLFAEDIRQLINFLRRDFSNANVIVTYHERGNEISKYASAFEADMKRLGNIRYLKLSIQEPDAHGVNRVAVVELSNTGLNEVRVQGVQESWVVGKAEALAAHLRRYQSALSTTFKKFDLNFQAVFFLTVLVLIPDLTLTNRTILVVVVVLSLWAWGLLHNRYVPNVLIHLDQDQPRTLGRIWPQAVSWTLAVTAALAAAIGYGILSGDLKVRNIFDQLTVPEVTEPDAKSKKPPDKK